MKRQFIPAEEAFMAWRKDPDYVAAYDALEADFPNRQPVAIALSDITGAVPLKPNRRGKASKAAELAGNELMR